MAETKFKFKKCELLPNQGSSLDENYNIIGGGPVVDYYESIDSPTISMNLTFIDVDQVISRKGISGGENICLLYTSPSPRDTERSRMPSSA